MAAKTLPGFKREAGSARGYVHVASGQRLTRRQYEALKVAHGAKETMTPQRYAKQVRSQRGYNRVLHAYVRKARARGQRGTDGKPLGKGEARQSAEFKSIVRDIRAGSRRPKSGQRSEAQDVLLRAALKRAGLRDGIPDWVPVGLSDARRKGLIKRRRDIPRKFRFAA